MIKLLLLCGMLACVKCNVPLSKAEQDVSDGNNLLGFKIYKELAQKPGNILFSPASAETILALTYTGAGGDTAKEMQSALGLPDSASTAAGYKSLLQKLKSKTSDVIFTSANKIYPAKGSTVKPEFLKIAQESFYSDVQDLDFNDNAGSAKIINQFVEEQTNNKIKDLIDPDSLDATTRMVLINAVYFLGAWKQSFESSSDKLKFYTSESESKEVPFMHTEQMLYYAENNKLNAQIVDIPYTDTDYALRIIVPRQINGLADIESQFPLDLQAQTNELNLQMVHITMPKFKIEQTIELTELLKKIGMNKAFDASADFSGISDEKLYISKVLQKAFIEVKENGTEAAAATAVFTVTYSLPRPTLYVNADKPFLFYLVNKSSNLISFVGRLADVN